MTLEIIELVQAIETFCISTTDIPGGIPVVFRELEGRVGSLKGKKFYGAVTCDGRDLLYRACVKKEPGMNLPGTSEYIIPAGKYARTVMNDWQSRIPMIKETFIQMMKHSEPDHSRPQVEYYRSNNELILLQPVI
jgi:hypothetical protein